MAEPVPGSHAHQRELGPQDSQLPGRRCAVAAMVADLQHVNVAERPVSNQWLKHVTLSITGQDRREPPTPGTKDDTCLVGSGVLNRRPGPDHIERQAADDEARTS
jgi:hypothetical protein